MTRALSSRLVNLTPLPAPICLTTGYFQPFAQTGPRIAGLHRLQVRRTYKRFGGSISAVRLLRGNINSRLGFSDRTVASVAVASETAPACMIGS
jgi:hypothetical protein